MKSKILKEVVSPFTDELIQELIKKYISCGCNDNLFYNEINDLGSAKTNDDTFTRLLIDKIYSQGINKGLLWTQNKANDSQLIYDINNSWVILYSEDDPMKDQQITSDKKSPLIYRIYLNLKGKEKSEFIENYIKKCQENKIPFNFKFSKNDLRNDQIILLSRIEHLEENIIIIEDLTSNLQLGKLPMLIGKYKDGIGIAEEYYNRLYSPTKVKLALVRSSVKKYLCDNKDDFYNQLSDAEKQKIDEYINEFAFLYDMEMEEKEILEEDYKDWKKCYYQRKSTIDCTKEHIENGSDAYVCGTGLLELGNAIQQIYSKNPEQFIHEITQIYRMIGTQVWGFSKDFVFSNETEEKFIKTEELLSKEQISSELEVISRKGLIDKTQTDLIAIAETKKSQKEIEQ